MEEYNELKSNEIMFKTNIVNIVLGNAIKLALKQGHIIIMPIDNKKLSEAIWNEKGLLEWYEKEVE